jgi:UDP:flavonoid glycosyltransferase YjiC (YdhE family)
VQLVANPYFAEEVAKVGLEFSPISTEAKYREMMASPHIWRPTKAIQMILRQVVLELLRPLYELVEQHYVAGETVVAAHTLDAASRVFRDKTGARVATVTFSPQAMWSFVDAPEMGAVPIGPRFPRWWNNTLFRLSTVFLGDPILRWPLNRFRRELDLSGVPHLFPDWWFASDTNICLFPEWYAPLPADLPRPVEAVGFPLWDAGDHTPLPDDCEQFLAASEPPIVFTPGTANLQAAEFFATAVEVCRRLDRRGLLLTKFTEQVPAELPDSMAHFSFVPLTRLLPRVAAFVHHGGIGSSSQGLAAGVPQLIRPLAFDQFDNAARLRRLGVAEELRPKQFTVERASAALERLLNSQTVVQRCEEFAAQCDGPASIGRACDLLESLAPTC